MGDTVYRPDPEADCYVVWYDEPVFVGDQKQLRAHLHEQMECDLKYERLRRLLEIEQRIERANEHGTSSLIGREVEGFTQRGMVPREKMLDYADRYIDFLNKVEGAADPVDMLIPHEEG